MASAGEPMPDEVFDHLATILHFYCDALGEFGIFVMRPGSIDHHIKEKVMMNKSDLFDAIRKYHEFASARLILIPYLEKKHCEHNDGHWLLFVVDLSSDTLFTFDSVGRFKGAESAGLEIRTCFIAPHLCYMKEYDGPLDQPPKGRVKDDFGLIRRAEEFKAKFLTPKDRQEDNYSCGFRVVHAILLIILERRVPQSITEAAALNVEEYRQLILKLMQTRDICILKNAYQFPLPPSRLLPASIEAKTSCANKEEEEKDGTESARSVSCSRSLAVSCAASTHALTDQRTTTAPADTSGASVLAATIPH